ncbi:hypothetical protein [Acidipropionibacterium jensenii]|uniref:Uncharacterized protein n=1 Tax=Acidipropionibacterium jensenii TaxID=1749 RepID=A0A448NZM9_9ACTN|nr:hypothetical protein [Acidipropionibacterium jensenii]MDN5976377.1 hypothetical protein [Acidipropionibacterium jensenii]MDN5995595.1 hypothetical protein [Acidipropionibacterium jensenii]MDN6425663.1 hypothetical protein [Acidipropionibacterium jensenii]MDN6440575.1 hypothetical protein [Acidipropionibacterium jensenii]MDN6479443.1 hypothetical protein [Acidipropionibacterium jensenii]
MLCALVVTPAWAAPSVQTQHLCTQSAAPCSIQMRPQQREGAAASVMVTGRARTTVSVTIYRLTAASGKATGIMPLQRSVDVRTNDQGYGSVSVAFQANNPRQDAGWILAAPSDIAGNASTWDPSQVVGSIASYASRRPTILGDGYGPQKPVGQPLDLQFTNAILGTRFAVEYLADDGAWHGVSTGTFNPVQSSDGISHVSYTVPQGLQSRPYQFRLFNITDPSAVAQQWAVTPAVNAPTQPRVPMLAIPKLGASVGGHQVAGRHSSTPVIASAGALAGISAAGVIAWPALALRRRRNQYWRWTP